MPFGTPSPKKPKGKPQAINWGDRANNLCVAEPGWENVTITPWTMKMCTTYVKMTHISKLWTRERIEGQKGRMEGQISSCKSQHFVHRYEECSRVGQLRDSKTNVMTYQLMAMVWAEIVLQKDIDWKTMPAKDSRFVNRTHRAIDASWSGLSDCIPEWSNRKEGDLPEFFMPSGDDPWTDDDEEGDGTGPVTCVKTETRAEERENLEYERQLEEARRNSLQDYGPYYGHGGSYSNPLPPTTSRSERGSRTTTHHDRSSHGGSHYYHGHNEGASHGHQGGSSEGHASGGGYQGGAVVPPPTFALPNYRNYGDYYGGGPYVGVYSATKAKDSDSDSD